MSMPPPQPACLLDILECYPEIRIPEYINTYNGGVTTASQNALNSITASSIDIVYSPDLQRTFFDDLLAYINEDLGAQVITSSLPFIQTAEMLNSLAPLKRLMGELGLQSHLDKTMIDLVNILLQSPTFRGSPGVRVEYRLVCSGDAGQPDFAAYFIIHSTLSPGQGFVETSFGSGVWERCMVIIEVKTTKSISRHGLEQISRRAQAGWTRMDHQFVESFTRQGRQDFSSTTGETELLKQVISSMYSRQASCAIITNGEEFMTLLHRPHPASIPKHQEIRNQIPGARLQAGTEHILMSPILSAVPVPVMEHMSNCPVGLILGATMWAIQAAGLECYTGYDQRRAAANAAGQESQVDNSTPRPSLSDIPPRNNSGAYNVNRGEPSFGGNLFGSARGTGTFRGSDRGMGEGYQTKGLGDDDRKDSLFTTGSTGHHGITSETCRPASTTPPSFQDHHTLSTPSRPTNLDDATSSLNPQGAAPITPPKMPHDPDTPPRPKEEQYMPKTEQDNNKKRPVPLILVSTKDTALPPSPELTPEDDFVPVKSLGSVRLSVVIDSPADSGGARRPLSDLHFNKTFYGPFKPKHDASILPVLLDEGEGTKPAPWTKSMTLSLQGSRGFGTLCDVFDGTLVTTEGGALISTGPVQQASPVIVKFVHLSAPRPGISTSTILSESDARKLLLNEIALYQSKLSGLQGRVVPRCLGWWGSKLASSGQGQGSEVWCGIFEDVGEVMPDWERFDAGLRSTVLALYRELHLKGVLHNDISWRHILSPKPGVIQGGHPALSTAPILARYDMSKVRVVDFDRALTRQSVGLMHLHPVEREAIWTARCDEELGFVRGMLKF